mmetsp:Transcript_9218/g.23568  ORF Transcript_9218/g.23568 Transcript_9218/m.23568 type:complete len:242 (+) Transcript_9218:3-728(+)
MRSAGRHFTWRPTFRTTAPSRRCWPRACRRHRPTRSRGRLCTSRRSDCPRTSAAAAAPSARGCTSGGSRRCGCCWHTARSPTSATSAARRRRTSRRCTTAPRACGCCGGRMRTCGRSTRTASRRCSWRATGAPRRRRRGLSSSWRGRSMPTWPPRRRTVRTRTVRMTMAAATTAPPRGRGARWRAELAARPRREDSIDARAMAWVAVRRIAAFPLADTIVWMPDDGGGRQERGAAEQRLGG